MRRSSRALAALATGLLAALSVGVVGAQPAGAATTARTPISHFVFLMQGDRSFDNYFGSYPGADGPPAGTCQPLAIGGSPDGCVRPFALHGKDVEPLAVGNSVVEAQYDDGKMDGFVAAYRNQGRDGTSAMGFYDERDLSFSWSMASRYTLFDHFFSAARYGTRTNRSYWVAAAGAPGGGEKVPAGGYGDQPTIFDRLQAAGVSWKFYVQDYNPKETFRSAAGGAAGADATAQTTRVPLLNYPRFVDDAGLSSHIVDLDQYYRDLADGTLPAVAYIASSGASERSARSIPAGQKLVRNLVTQLMVSRYWSSSALMWSYDGSGGWYDHVAPPTVDGQSLGFRVPALLVSPYVPHGEVNHTTLDYTSALRFVEDNWGLQPLSSRDATATSLAGAFRFTAKPRPADVVPVGPSEPHPPLVKLKPIYWYYGGAAGLALLLMLCAVVVPAITRIRRKKSEVSVL